MTPFAPSTPEDRAIASALDAGNFTRSPSTAPPPAFRTVHVLWRGTTLCGNVHGLPRDWGRAHAWVGLPDPEWPAHSTCATCREAAVLFVLSGLRP